VHFVGEEGLLLDHRRQRLYALNACATIVWSLLEEGKSAAEASRFLAEQFAMPAKVAASYVADVVRQYAALCQDPSPAPETPIAAPREVKLPADTVDRAGVVRTYTLLGSVIRVHYGDEALCEDIHPIVQHNAVDEASNLVGIIDVVVLQEGGTVSIFADREECGASAIAEAAVALRACLIRLAVKRSGGLCALHAGALARDGKALLLPGDAGHGKSTLSAGLAARGFEMLSDDTTLLTGTPPIVRCIPVGLCIKRGAYPVLEPLYPRLAALPERRRPDGREARYLSPADLCWASENAAVAVRWIVFPRYHPEQGTALRPVSRHDALVRLMRGVYFLSGSLDERSLEQLIAWIEGIECFELPIASLDAGTSILRELCQ